MITEAPVKKPKPLPPLDDPQRLQDLRIQLSETRRETERLLRLLRPHLLPEVDPVQTGVEGWQKHYLRLMLNTPYNVSGLLDRLVQLRDDLKVAEKRRATFLAKRQAAWQQRMDRWVQQTAKQREERPF